MTTEVKWQQNLFSVCIFVSVFVALYPFFIGGATFLIATVYAIFMLICIAILTASSLLKKISQVGTLKSLIFCPSCGNGLPDIKEANFAPHCLRDGTEIPGNDVSVSLCHHIGHRFIDVNVVLGPWNSWASRRRPISEPIKDQYLLVQNSRGKLFLLTRRRERIEGELEYKKVVGLHIWVSAIFGALYPVFARR